MTSLTVLSAKYGFATKSLRRLFEGEGLEFDDDGFEIEKCHQKAINELGKKRVSPYVIAYALWCREVAGPDEEFIRYDNLVEIADARGFCLRDAISEIHPKQVENDRLPQAKYWIDRATGVPFDRDAIDRIATWCRLVLSTAPYGVGYAYLAVRLLFSLPFEEMSNYPRRVQRALNLAIHYGALDGWHRTIQDRDGTKRRVFQKPKFDL